MRARLTEKKESNALSSALQFSLKPVFPQNVKSSLALPWVMQWFAFWANKCFLTRLRVHIYSWFCKYRLKYHHANVVFCLLLKIICWGGPKALLTCMPHHRGCLGSQSAHQVPYHQPKLYKQQSLVQDNVSSTLLSAKYQGLQNVNASTTCFLSSSHYPGHIITDAYLHS